METLKCGKCQIDKPVDQFYKRKDCLSGYRRNCKTCVNVGRKEYLANYYLENKERQQPARAEWRENNRDAARAYQKDYHASNKDRINFAKRQAYLKDSESKKARGRLYYHANKERLNSLAKLWRGCNKDAIAARMKAYRAKTGTRGAPLKLVVVLRKSMPVLLGPTKNL